MRLLSCTHVRIQLSFVESFTSRIGVDRVLIVVIGWRVRMSFSLWYFF